MVGSADKSEGLESREKLFQEGWNSQGLEDIPLRKSKRVLMPFAFREGILTGLIVWIPFVVVVVVVLIYTVWSGSGGNVMCLLSLLLSGIMVIILAAISSRRGGKSG